MNSQCILLFKSPENFVLNATHSQWTLLISEARQQALLGSIYFLLRDLELLAKVPSSVFNHLVTGFHYAEKQKNTLLQEMLELEQVFQGAEYPCILVKGVGYRLSGLAMARGRIFSDIDLLIPHTDFKDALSRLVDAGYLESGMSDYDRRYYIQWSHQHPPLTHFLRGANIDLHHHIFPVASNSGLAIEPMLTHSEKLAGSVFSVPSLPYLLVHASVHLFYQEETHKLVKDLCDLKQIYQECIKRHSPEQILHASQNMRAQAAVFYALDTLVWLFAENVDLELLKNLSVSSSKYRRWQMHYLLKNLLSTSVFNHLAHSGWFIRGHLLKMGFVTLVYHSVAKFWETQKIRRQQSEIQRQLDEQMRPHDAE
jgi:hypothetical protein